MRSRAGAIIGLLSDRTARRFALVGVANTVLGFGLILLLRGTLGDRMASVLSYLAVLPLAYFVHRAFAFEHDGPIARSAPLYLVGAGLRFVATFAALTAALFAGVPGVIAQILSIGTGFVTQLLVARRFVFPVLQPFSKGSGR